MSNLAIEQPMILGYLFQSTYLIVCNCKQQNDMELVLANFEFDLYKNNNKIKTETAREILLECRLPQQEKSSHRCIQEHPH